MKCKWVKLKVLKYANRYYKNIIALKSENHQGLPFYYYLIRRYICRHIKKQPRCRFHMQILNNKKTEISLLHKALTSEHVQGNTFPFYSDLCFNLPTSVKQSDKDKLKGNAYNVFVCGSKLSQRYYN